MITKDDYEDYVKMLRDCSVQSLLRMNDLIGKELSARYTKIFPFTQPHSEITRLKRFMEVFNELRQLARSDSINQLFFINALVNTADFTPEEAEAYIKKAMENGQIYEKRSGLLAKA